MKILFLNPPGENTVPEIQTEEGNEYMDSSDVGAFAPLGLLYVLSYLEKKQPEHDYFFLDCVGEKLSYHGLEQKVKKIQPDIVGITSFTISLVDVCLSAKTIRKVVPNAHICMGGHHPIAFPFLAAQLTEFDSIVVGEGEIAFADLVTAIKNNDDYTKIQGVYTKESIECYKGEKFVDNRFLTTVSVPPAYIEEVEMLPIPNRKYIRHINYGSTVGFSANMASVISTRGCPYRCTFCDVPYKRYRKRDMEDVVDEIETCLEMGYDEIRFYDDLFNIKPERVIEFCDIVDRRGLKFTWDFRGRVNTTTRESLVRAKKSGLRMISFGIETGSDEALKFLKKGTTVLRMKQTFKWCRELGILSDANFIIGLPFEKNEEDIRKNVDFLISLNPDYTLINILMLLPNTEIFNQAVEKGLTSYDDWVNFALNPSNDFAIGYWTEHMSVNELVAIHRRMMHRFYFRPQYIWQNVIATRSVYEFNQKVIGVLKLLAIYHYIRRKKRALFTKLFGVPQIDFFPNRSKPVFTRRLAWRKLS